MNNNNPNSKEFETLCSGYVLNALSEEERAQFEEMLQDADASQKQLYQQLKATADQMAFTVDRETPAPEVKQALMNRIKGSKTVAVERKSKSSRFMMAAAASLAFFIITIVLAFYVFQLSDTIGDKKQIIAQQEERIIKLKNKVHHREQLLSILSARTVDLIVMSGTDVNTNGYGKIIWDPEKNRAILQVSNLPPEPANKDYQLWIIANKKPLSAGVFSVNTTNEASFFKVEKIPDVTQQVASAFAVTLEPEGGSMKPTGPMYLLGSAKGQ